MLHGQKECLNYMAILLNLFIFLSMFGFSLEASIMILNVQMELGIGLNFLFSRDYSNAK
jgi:hypothetical protein